MRVYFFILDSQEAHLSRLEVLKHNSAHIIADFLDNDDSVVFVQIEERHLVFSYIGLYLAIHSFWNFLVVFNTIVFDIYIDYCSRMRNQKIAL